MRLRILRDLSRIRAMTTPVRAIVDAVIGEAGLDTERFAGC
jgi:hypothetical protein